MKEPKAMLDVEPGLINCILQLALSHITSVQVSCLF